MHVMTEWLKKAGLQWDHTGNVEKLDMLEITLQ